MPRTTIDLDASVLNELKARQRREGKSLGRIASQLLARALAEDGEGKEQVEPFTWTSQSMGARLDLQDKDAVLRCSTSNERDRRREHPSLRLRHGQSSALACP